MTENEREERLKFKFEKKNKVGILKLIGDLDMYTVPLARTKIKEIIEKEKVSKLLIDLKEMDYIDSSGLGFFIGALKKLREHNGNLKLINLNSYIKGIFKLIQLDYVIEICDDEEEAIKRLTTSELDSGGKTCW